MRICLLAGVAGLMALTACSPPTPAPAEEAAAPAPAVEPAPAPPVVEPQHAATPAEDLDPFVVMIGAERWTVILERSLEGIIEAPDVSGADKTDLYRADAALKRGAAMTIELRNWVCGRGVLTGDACKLPAWPAWTQELPTGDTPIDEIDRRSAWLSEVMSPFTDAGCEAGRKASKDEMFCSVE